MSTTTSNLGLFKYDVNTDTNVPFSITEALNNNWDIIDAKCKGGSLEICDIGMALYVDETKGLRRYLNGQIVDINTNTQKFLNRLKQITTLYPSLLCTEEEWQTAKTMSAFGQVGKFVFNYSGDEIVSVRIPRVVNIQGVFDLQNLGMTVSAGLPNITGGFTSRGIENINMNGWGAFNAQNSTDNFSYGHAKGQGGGFNFDASRSSSIYGKSNTVQQEAIQYPYFIQIATGSETENNIVNDIELNNPSFFGDSKYVPTKVNNLSWLKSEGQSNPKGTYPSFYDWILENVNKGEKGFKLSTATDITDYDFVLNTSDETFRLPLLDGSEDLVGSTELRFDSADTGSPFSWIAGQNGHIIITFSGNNVGDWVSIHNATQGSTHITRASFVNAWEMVSMDVKRGDNVRVSYDDTTKDRGYFFYPYKGNGSLYYYVGEIVQNAKLVDAGRIGEELANKVDINNVTNYCMPDYAQQIVSDNNVSGTLIQVPKDSFVVVWGADPYMEDYYCFVTDDTSKPKKYVVGKRSDDTNGYTESTSFTFPLPKNWYFTCTAEAGFGYRIFPYKGAK